MKKAEKILVTGGAGFIGSEIVRQLLGRDYRVRIVDNFSNNNSQKNQMNKKIDIVRGDLKNYEVADKAMQDIDICIHLAALVGGIKYFNSHSASILTENNLINSNVFRSASEQSITRMVYMSSCVVYERDTYFPYLEKDMQSIPPPLNPYAFSKLTGEYYCKAYFEEHALRYSILRPFNVYGVNEYPDKKSGNAHVIPDLISKIVSGQYPLQLFGDGSQSRCFTHVSDVARGVIMAAGDPKAENEDFNLSTKVETRIDDLAKLIWKLSGRQQEFKYVTTESLNYDSKRRSADPDKIFRLLGWQAEISLEKGLPPLIEWIKAHRSN